MRFPHIVRMFGVNVRKDKIEHIRVPAGCVTINTVFDVLDIVCQRVPPTQGGE